MVSLHIFQHVVTVKSGFDSQIWQLQKGVKLLRIVTEILLSILSLWLISFNRMVMWSSLTYGKSALFFVCHIFNVGISVVQKFKSIIYFCPYFM